MALPNPDPSRSDIRREQSANQASSRDRIRDAAKALFAERGYEGSSTSEICRRAGTSESQLVKHFTNKQGVLEAIFQDGWEQLNLAVTLAIERMPSATDKLGIIVDILVTFLQKDPDQRTVFLLEGRRKRGDGHLVVLVPAFLDFVRIVDRIIGQMSDRGELAAGVHPEAMRSALMGALEGLLRDQMLARTSRFPATYTEADYRTIFATFLSAFAARPPP
jgi:AcrR family transcriptional regulator